MRISRKSFLTALGFAKVLRLGVPFMVLFIGGLTAISAQNVPILTVEADDSALFEPHCNGDVVSYTVKWTLEKPSCDSSAVDIKDGTEKLTLVPSINRGTIQSISITSGGMTSNPPVSSTIPLPPNTSGTVVVTVQWTDIAEEDGDLLLDFEYSVEARCETRLPYTPFIEFASVLFVAESFPNGIVAITRNVESFCSDEFEFTVELINNPCLTLTGIRWFIDGSFFQLTDGSTTTISATLDALQDHTVTAEAIYEDGDIITPLFSQVFLANDPTAGGEVSGPTNVSIGQTGFYEFTTINGTIEGVWEIAPASAVNTTVNGNQIFVEFLTSGTVNINYATTVCGSPVDFPIDVLVSRTGGSPCILCRLAGEGGLSIPNSYNSALGQPIQIGGLEDFETGSFNYELTDLTGKRVQSGVLDGNLQLNNPQMKYGLHVLRITARADGTPVLAQKLLVY